MKRMKANKDMLIMVATVIVVGGAMGAVSGLMPDTLGMSERSEYIFHYVLFAAGFGVIFGVRNWLRKRPK